MTDLGTCQVPVKAYPATRLSTMRACGRPAKRDGMCGLHAAAADRRAARERAEDAEIHLTPKQAEAIRDLYVKWTLGPNPILQAAGALLRDAGGFRLTTAELAQNGQPFIQPDRRER